MLDSLDNSPKIIVDFIEQYGKECHVSKTKTLIVDGRVEKERSYYNDVTKMIVMDESKDDAEYAKTFRHELGHFADDILGRISFSEYFGDALEADKYWLDNSTTMGQENISEMLADLESFDVMDSMYISDILSGVFLNDTKIRDAYENNGMSFYGHDVNTYWLAWDPADKIVQQETFANMFAIYASGDKNSFSFMEKWFPNTTRRFQKEVDTRIYG